MILMYTVWTSKTNTQLLIHRTLTSGLILAHFDHDIERLIAFMAIFMKKENTKIQYKTYFTMILYCINDEDFFRLMRNNFLKTKTTDVNNSL